MRRDPVTSSSVAEVGYDEQAQTLEIQFRHGGVYRYFGVPPTVHEELRSASSLGRYVTAEIKGRYRYTRV